MNEAQVSRELLRRAIVFLEQFKQKLDRSDYPPDSYKADSVEDILHQLRGIADERR